MKQKLLDELMEVSEEEQKYLDGQGDIERQLYVKEKIEEIDRELLLKRGQLITVRPHSRFVDFPEHRHNYVEIMYVAQGSITHCIEGKELVLHKGDVLMLNQQVVHSIKRADYQDIGINFIALPEFFEVPLYKIPHYYTILIILLKFLYFHLKLLFFYQNLHSLSIYTLYFQQLLFLLQIIQPKLMLHHLLNLLLLQSLHISS